MSGKHKNHQHLRPRLLQYKELVIGYFLFSPENRERACSLGSSTGAAQAKASRINYK